MSTNPWQVEGLYPDPRVGPFRLRLAFGQVRGRTVITAVELRGVAPEIPWPTEIPELPDAAIQAADIRLPLGKLLDEWTARNAALARASRSLWPGNEANVQSFEQQAGVKHRGRPRLTNEFLRQVAAIYNAAVADGDRAPAMRVYKELSATTPNTARGWIRKARQRGVMPSSTRITTSSKRGQG
jgi:hypothetical protein